MNKPLLSLVIPAYNEAERISDMLAELDGYLNANDISSEIIVVDDGSRDATSEVVRRLEIPRLKLIKNDRNRGKGYSVRRGLGEARGSIALFKDADGSTSPCEIDRFLKGVSEGYDVVIGSRYLPESRTAARPGAWRNIMSWTFRTGVRTIFRFPYRDTQYGFKMLSRKALDAILPLCRENGFLFDIEILYFAQSAGLKVLEQPITWTNRAGSKINLINGPVKMSLGIIALRMKTLFAVNHRTRTAETDFIV